MFGPARHRGRTSGGQRGGGICIRQGLHIGEQAVKIIPIQGFGWHLQEEAVQQKPRDNRPVHLPGRRQRPARILWQIAPRQHQIVDRRIGGAGVEG